ncbi:hypothetical protein Tco_0358995 [Tanacetum coccineum]
MEKANLPPTNNRPVLPVALRTQAVQELYELQRISAFVDLSSLRVNKARAVMSFESSMVTYTFVYTNFEPGRVFWGADEELSDVVSPTSHARQPLPPVVSPTAKSPGYVTESDPEEDPEEYEDDGIGVMGRLLSHGRGRDGER